MKYTTAGLLLLSALALLAGCSSHPAYYVAPPPPPGPAAYAEPPLIQAAHQNGFAEGVNVGERDRVDGHSYRPTNSRLYANTPGYSPQLGGPFWQYQSAYRDAYMRGYRKGYQRG
ncbi:hypothetical protein [Acidobacterium sp. S8]|uniref:hypothetical protein n=1 Tax=Acidobacterium sp. S8 TaxID=1641854 RepID=UPI00131A9818|nr:hypothetical protein [Acidobacterium sp. S8]